MPLHRLSHHPDRRARSGAGRDARVLPRLRAHRDCRRDASRPPTAASSSRSSPRRAARCSQLRVGVDDADDLARAAASARAARHLPCGRERGALTAHEPVSGVHVDARDRAARRAGAERAARDERPGARAAQRTRARPRSLRALARPAQALARRARLERRAGDAPLLRRRARLPRERRDRAASAPRSCAARTTTTTCSCSRGRSRSCTTRPGRWTTWTRSAPPRPRWSRPIRSATPGASAATPSARNYFWYLRDPAGNFAEYTSDLDVIVDEEAWKVAASMPAHGLAAWGPPVPREFLAPDDIVALARGAA